VVFIWQMMINENDNFEIGQFAYLEFRSGNESKKHNEWSSHFIAGHYEIVKVEDEKIYLKEDGITFPVLKSRITKFEVVKK
jgi:hypothetical protein